MQDKIEGKVDSIIFRNDENGYSVFRLVPLDKKSAQKKAYYDSVVAVGQIAMVQVGEEITLYGEWTEHPSYGIQFKFEQSEANIPSEEADVERFLGSGIIQGVGPATAKNIVKTFGPDALTIIETQPHLLAQVKGISAHKAEMIQQSYQENVGMKNALIQLQKYGLTTNQALKLSKAYGNRAESILLENPYCLVEEVEGIGFKRADEIAQKMGIKEYSPVRLQAGIQYVLGRAMSEGGHTCLPTNALCNAAAELIGVSSEEMHEQLRQLILSNKLRTFSVDGCDDDMVATAQMYHIETFCAKHIIDLQNEFEQDAAVTFDVEQELAALERESELTLDSMQRQAILSAFESGVSIITGGPGTGKTTIIRFLLLLLKQAGFSCVLCAPTGRAAKRMSDTSGEEAKTIHRLLEYTGTGFMRDEDNPLDCDVLIVDEMSMVDTMLFYRFLKAVSLGTRIIFVGDVDQLPSVGAGNVLKDLIKSDLCPTVKLNHVFRQENLSRIVENAHRINQGEMPLLDFCPSFAYESIANQQAILERLVGICKRGTLGDVWTNLQILTPMKKGVLGVHNINERLQAVMNPPSKKKHEAKYKHKLFREGDKVLQIKNDYSMEWSKPDNEKGSGVFNGDMAIIGHIDTPNEEVELCFDDGRRAFYEYKELDNVELAYAISIHKSQGSEFPIVLLPLYMGAPILMTRNLIYTAVTRARDCVVMLGQEEALRYMVNNVQIQKRYSSFLHCVKQVQLLQSS